MNQNVVITAGASGIGRAIAARFIAEGNDVTICDINREALVSIAREFPRLHTVEADVASPVDVDRLFESTAEPRLPLVLVNNAGIAGPRAPIDETSVEQWRATLDVNLTGAFLCMRRAAQQMKKAKTGLIVNVITASVRTKVPFRSAYIASKAGLLGLSHSAARELGPYGIRVNAILPGFVKGARSRAVLSKIAAEKRISLKAATEEALRYISMRCTVHAEEIAAAVYWLASPEAEHISGQEIAVDGNVEWED